MATIAWKYNIGITTVRVIIGEVCEAIALKFPLNAPSTEVEWNSIAEEFMNNFSFPNCIG